MPLKSFIKLHFVVILPLVILNGVLLTIPQPHALAASNGASRASITRSAVETNMTNNTASVTTVVTNPVSLSCNDPGFTLPIDLADQYYGQVIPLLENQGVTTVALQSAYAGVPNALEKSLDEFSILKEGDTYYLWIANRLKTGQSSPFNTLEQRLESKNGLVWCNRTDTNLIRTDTYKYSLGPRNIIKNGSLYEGWDAYYYEPSMGWGYAVRYITSTNGINWTVVNEPALIGTESTTVVKEGNTYRMWTEPHGDNSYQGSRSLRYRTSTNGDTGWGNWQTGGTVVSLDDQEPGNSHSRVRRLADGTHQLFYLRNNAIHLATSANGITFTTQISNFVNLAQVFPITNGSPILFDFAVVNVDGEDWVYLSYCKTTSAIGRCIDSYMGVARPAQNAAPTSSTHLPIILRGWPPSSFPIHIGDAIQTRPANPKGEVFYNQAVQIPDQLPVGGNFYFSSQPDTLAKVLVDDKMIVLLNGVEIFSHHFSQSGSPQAVILKIPRSTMEQMAGKTVSVQYRDVYGMVVGASSMWLIWTP